MLMSYWVRSYACEWPLPDCQHELATDLFSAEHAREGSILEKFGICLGPASVQSTARREWQLTGAHFRRSNVRVWPVSDQLIGCAQAGFRIASNAARARNPERVSPCLRAWASTARRIRCGKVMLILAALSPSSLTSTSTIAQVQPR
jgi:hypothetical protein